MCSVYILFVLERKGGSFRPLSPCTGACPSFVRIVHRTCYQKVRYAKNIYTGIIVALLLYRRKKWRRSQWDFCAQFSEIKRKGDRMLAIEQWQCRLYPRRGCHTCLWECHESDKAATRWGDSCPNWQPCRGGHPSTENPCENGYFSNDLCWEHCADCPHARHP